MTVSVEPVVNKKKNINTTYPLSPHLPDNILNPITNLKIFYQPPIPYSSIGKSDHSSVLWTPKYKLSGNNNIRTRITRPMTDNSIRACGRWIQGQSWNEIFGCKIKRVATARACRTLSDQYVALIVYLLTVWL